VLIVRDEGMEGGGRSPQEKKKRKKKNPITRNHKVGLWKTTGGGTRPGRTLEHGLGTQVWPPSRGDVPRKTRLGGDGETDNVSRGGES